MVRGTMHAKSKEVQKGKKRKRSRTFGYSNTGVRSKIGVYGFSVARLFRENDTSMKATWTQYLAAGITSNLRPMAHTQLYSRHK